MLSASTFFFKGNGVVMFKKILMSILSGLTILTSVAAKPGDNPFEPDPRGMNHLQVTLPKELLIYVATFLKPKDLISFIRTSKTNLKELPHILKNQLIALGFDQEIIGNLLTHPQKFMAMEAFHQSVPLIRSRWEGQGFTLKEIQPFLSHYGLEISSLGKKNLSQFLSTKMAEESICSPFLICLKGGNNCDIEDKRKKFIGSITHFSRRSFRFIPSHIKPEEHTRAKAKVLEIAIEGGIDPVSTILHFLGEKWTEDQYLSALTALHKMSLYLKEKSTAEWTYLDVGDLLRSVTVNTKHSSPLDWLILGEEIKNADDICQTVEQLCHQYTVS